MTEQPNRLCATCRYFEPNRLFEGREKLLWGKCLRFHTSCSPIDGEPNDHMHARNARDVLGPCGKEGTEWEAK